jgi:hypothetical protein
MAEPVAGVAGGRLSRVSSCSVVVVGRRALCQWSVGGRWAPRGAPSASADLTRVV